jgi:hypothetical protein
MGKPTRNELLAEYYLRAAGVAAASIEATGRVGAAGRPIESEPDRIVYYCKRGSHFILAYRLYEWKKAVEADQAAIATKLEELAELGGVGLTARRVAVNRARGVNGRQRNDRQNGLDRRVQGFQPCLHGGSQGRPSRPIFRLHPRPESGDARLGKG